MATLVLQTAGAALGSAFGPVGSVVGRAAGALAGNFIDRSLFGEDRLIEGARLSDLDVQESREGAPIPRVYGRVRVAGQVIWATQFEEVFRDEQQGGKGGGPSVTRRNYSYFANFAVALCEGEIAHVGRVWADGELLDTTRISMRVYKGTETQAPDSLISTKQGAAQTPAYRGTAYIVFERFPIEAYGNRIPQLSFEVVRVVGELENRVTALQLIPGASEFLYDPRNVHESLENEAYRVLNRNIEHASTDMEASLDELQALCPNLKHVAIVASWFGSDLRAGDCIIQPKVEVPFRNILDDWQVAGLSRFFAPLVSEIDGGPAYGGTPSDDGLVRTIRDLKARGVQVTYNPFILMDVAPGNTLPDPYSPNGTQAAFPWRGRITSSIASGLSGSTDKTNAIDDEIAAFLGTAQRSDFSIQNDRVVFSGDEDWGYRRFILHAAYLCKIAGGVDAFLIGSEMRGLTRLRNAAGDHPFVFALQALAADVRQVLGNNTLITYGADWSEYFGYQPADGSGDVLYNLDPLWMDQNIDAIGIDNYMPLSDWRDGAQHLDQDLAASPYDTAYLQANVAGGEGFDWFYTDDVARQNQTRTDIIDGAYNKPWVFRYKDLKAWWSNQHFERPNGVENTQPTSWVPQSKPIIFTELGFPAIDKATNQPNVFFDPKSSESAVPYFSSGGRDDSIQRQGLNAVLSYWNDDENNPVSSHYGKPMVDVERTYLWAWDARPFPAFPHREDIWSDAENWRFGHWLTGRLGGVPLGEMIKSLVEKEAELAVDMSGVHATVDGYVISDRVSVRRALEPLLEAFQIDLLEHDDRLVVQSRDRNADSVLGDEVLVGGEGAAERTVQREQETELPSVLSLAYQDLNVDFRAVTCSTRRLVGESRRVRDAQIPIVSSYDRVLPIAEAWLQALWNERERFEFSVPNSFLSFEIGDILNVKFAGRTKRILISRIEDGAARRIEARSIQTAIRSEAATSATVRNGFDQSTVSFGPPLFKVLDLPLFGERSLPHAPMVGASANPWPGGVSLSASAGSVNFDQKQILERPAMIGVLASPLATGAVGVFDNANTLQIRFPHGTLSNVDDLVLFAGRNAVAVRARDGSWEVLQFSNAEPVSPNMWKVSRLLRAQLGTEDAMQAGFDPGTDVVVLNGAVDELMLGRAEVENALNVRAAPLGQDATFEFTSTKVFTSRRRGLLPLAPVHLQAKKMAGGDVQLTWIRRSRIDADLWEVEEVPLGEEQEEYEVCLMGMAGTPQKFRTTTPSLLIENNAVTTAFGENPDVIDVSIAQLSATEGAGVAREMTVTVQ